MIDTDKQTSITSEEDERRIVSDQFVDSSSGEYRDLITNSLKNSKQKNLEMGLDHEMIDTSDAQGAPFSDLTMKRRDEDIEIIFHDEKLDTLDPALDYFLKTRLKSFFNKPIDAAGAADGKPLEMPCKDLGPEISACMKEATEKDSQDSSLKIFFLYKDRNSSREFYSIFFKGDCAFSKQQMLDAAKKIEELEPSILAFPNDELAEIFRKRGSFYIPSEVAVDGSNELVSGIYDSEKSVEKAKDECLDILIKLIKDYLSARKDIVTEKAESILRIAHDQLMNNLTIVESVVFDSSSQNPYRFLQKQNYQLVFKFEKFHTETEYFFQDALLFNYRLVFDINVWKNHVSSKNESFIFYNASQVLHSEKKYGISKFSLLINASKEKPPLICIMLDHGALMKNVAQEQIAALLIVVVNLKIEAKKKGWDTVRLLLIAHDDRVVEKKEFNLCSDLILINLIEQCSKLCFQRLSDYASPYNAAFESFSDFDGPTMLLHFTNGLPFGYREKLAEVYIEELFSSLNLTQQVDAYAVVLFQTQQPRDPSPRELMNFLGTALARNSQLIVFRAGDFSSRAASIIFPSHKRRITIGTIDLTVEIGRLISTDLPKKMLQNFPFLSVDRKTYPIPEALIGNSNSTPSLSCDKRFYAAESDAVFGYLYNEFPYLSNFYALRQQHLEFIKNYYNHKFKQWITAETDALVNKFFKQTCRKLVDYHSQFFWERVEVPFTPSITKIYPDRLKKPNCRR